MTEHSARNAKPRIGITVGDPAGIGPEIVLKALADDTVRQCCIPVVICDAQMMAHQARKLDLVCGLDIVNDGESLPEDIDRPLIYNLNNLRGSYSLGVENEICGRAAAEYIEAAVHLCMSGDLDAMATAPINKKALFLAGYSFPGHTEFLQHLTGSSEVAMGFIADSLRIILLSTHLPLAQAINLVKKDRIVQIARLTHHELIRWGINNPRIAVAALNPHGAEGGLFGIEEASEILPAIETANEDPEFNVAGPFSADTIFLRAQRGEFDAVIACYHDQGMISVKCLSFGEAVNVTLGLPFIRTSVDHGTAFDIAGKGVADYGSMVEAIRLAADLVNRERDGRGRTAPIS
ncbi:MAG TPA: 4-hydroxythreonine-4-phosphate dehydrogenase PdxA [Blastocatellia bacterium]|nr:4-hydroxythreonine-4-phosphate dehydrogenase PdxA [Blastocatellia bacterium]